MSCDNWKLEKDLCRCCHAEGSFINLNLRCEDPQETYTDMLRDSLEIILTPVVGVLAEVTYKICEACILRLRDASNFKKQIIVCEERFKDMYSRNFIKIADSDFNAEVKEEIPDSDPEDLKEEYSNANAGVDDDDEGFNLIQLGAGCLDAADDETHDDRNGLEIVDIKLERKTRGRRKAKNPSVKKTKSEKKVGRPRKTIKEEEETKPIASAKQEKPKRDIYVSKDIQPDLEELYSVIQEQGQKRYICNVCGNLLTRKIYMNMHVFEKHLNTDMKCTLCKKTFNNKKDKKHHLKTMHGVEEVLVRNKSEIRPINTLNICGICNKEYANRATLISHNKAYHRYKQCPDCSKSFIASGIVKHRHEIHGFPIPTCGVCGYKNSRQSRVIVHQREVHLKEKNVACERCDMKFFDNYTLKKHMVKHVQDRKYECKFCRKRFARRDSLKLHEMIHTGEKNKACALCDERFVQKAGLNYHMLKRHPDAC